VSSHGMHGWRGAALAGALLVGAACSKPEEPALDVPPVASAPAAASPAPGGTGGEERRAPLVEQPSKVEYVMPRTPVTAQAPAGPPPADFKLGQSREDVLRLLGECAERMHFLPGGSGGLSVEVVQPKAGECRQRLGHRHFTLTGGVLQSISPGALPPPRPSKPSPEGV
jgi:hypothetical protein